MAAGQSKIPENSASKAWAIVSLVLIAVLLVLSVVFFKERMLFTDAPHNLFRIINDGHFHIEEHRYGSFITQIYPLLGSRLHIPVQGLMILYSASFNIFYLAVALLLVYKFKNYSLAVLFALYLTMFVSDTFYWSNNEVHQGIGWLMLAFAFNVHVATKNWSFLVRLVLFAATFFLAICTHPLVMLAAVYLWFFFWLGNISWPYTKTQSYIYTGVLLILAYLKFYQGQHQAYDNSKIGLVTHFDLTTLRSIYKAPQLHLFLSDCVTNYWLLVILFATGLITLIKLRKLPLFLLTLLFTAGYLLLVAITFGYIGHLFYMQSEYATLSVICSAPFVYFALPGLKQKVGIIILSLIFVIRLAYILNAAPAFTNTVLIQENILHKMKEKGLYKVIILEPATGLDSALIMNWGAPASSMLISKLNGETPQRTFTFLDPDEISANIISKDTLLGCWIKWPAAKLNSYYFQMDTTSTYRAFTYPSLMQ